MIVVMAQPRRLGKACQWAVGLATTEVRRYSSLGATEAALVAGLVGIGVADTQAVPAVFLFRIGTFWLPILPGWAAFTWLRRTDRLEQRVDRRCGVPRPVLAGAVRFARPGQGSSRARTPST